MLNYRSSAFFGDFSFVVSDKRQIPSVTTFKSDRFPRFNDRARNSFDALDNVPTGFPTIVQTRCANM